MTQQHSTHDISVTLKNRGEAENVIDALEDLIKRFGMASVADLYDLVGITAKFNDNKWGWNDIRTASVQPTLEGYLLKMPQTMSIAL